MRRFLLPVSLLVAAVLLNIAVTWAIARLSDRFLFFPPVSSTTVVDIPATAADFLNDPIYLDGFGNRPTGITLDRYHSLLWTRLTFTRWHEYPGSLGYSRSHDLFQYGLPFRAMQFEEQSSFNFAAFPEGASWRIRGLRGGWPIAPAESKQSLNSILNGDYSPPEHVYPLTILPLGFLANTSVYTCLIAAVLLLPRALRRRLRLRRGKCAQCAYPLAAALSRCPECGTIPPRCPA